MPLNVERHHDGESHGPERDLSERLNSSDSDEL
jgi:hypothetical protein